MQPGSDTCPGVSWELHSAQEEDWGVERTGLESLAYLSLAWTEVLIGGLHRTLK